MVSIRLYKFICEHFDARTNDHLSKAHFCFCFFFFKIMLESWGCGLYTSAAYTRVFTVHIYKTLFFAYRTYYFSFDGASSCIAWAQQTPKVRVYVHVEGSRGMFPWKNWNLVLLKSPAMSLHVFSTLYTSSEILSNFYHHSISFQHNNLHFNNKKN